jgi:hypothetical protein
MSASVPVQTIFGNHFHRIESYAAILCSGFGSPCQSVELEEF